LVDRAGAALPRALYRDMNARRRAGPAFGLYRPRSRMSDVAPACSGWRLYLEPQGRVAGCAPAGLQRKQRV